MKKIESQMELSDEQLESVAGGGLIKGIDAAADVVAGFVAGVGAYMKTRNTVGGGGSGNTWTGGDHPTSGQA